MKVRRSQLDELGDLQAPRGSRSWAIAVRDELNNMLHRAEFSSSSARTWCDAIRENDAWKVLEDSQRRPFKSYEAFCTHRKPQGLGRQPADIDRIIAERKEREVQIAREHPLPERGEVGRGRNRVDNINSKTNGGTGRSYTLRRLARDRPDLLDKVEKRKLSANAAAVEAGFRKRPTPFDKLRSAWKQADEGMRQKFLSWIESP
jgi:hypothetical protein